MSNKIDGNLQSVLNKAGERVSEASKGGATAKGGEAAGSGAPAAADKVVLTEQSQLLASLAKTVSEMPAIDQARVDAVKADIENGNYEINLDSLAELLMQSDAQLDD